MRKLFVLLILLFSVDLAAAVAPTNYDLAVIENADWTSALDVSGVIPNDTTVTVKKTNCKVGPVPEFNLHFQEVQKYATFGKDQCGITIFGLTTLQVNGGVVDLHTAAIFTDPVTKVKSKVDIPTLVFPITAKNTDPVTGMWSDSAADVQRVSNKINGSSAFFAFFPSEPTYLTLFVFDGFNSPVGTETVYVTGPTFYELQTPVTFGRVSIQVGVRNFGCVNCEGAGSVKLIFFDGFRAGGVPRAEVPKIRHFSSQP